MLVKPLSLWNLKLKRLDAYLELALQQLHLGLMTTALIVEEASMVRIKVSEPALELRALVFKRSSRDVLRQLASANGGLRKAVGIMPPTLPFAKGRREFHLVSPLTKGEFDVRVLATVVASDGGLRAHNFVAGIEEGPLQRSDACEVSGGRLGTNR